MAKRERGRDKTPRFTVQYQWLTTGETGSQTIYASNVNLAAEMVLDLSAHHKKILSVKAIKKP